MANMGEGLFDSELEAGRDVEGVRRRMEEAQKKQMVEHILKTWKPWAKGPTFTADELGNIRNIVARGGSLDHDECRRLLQMADAAHCGFVLGILEEFPPLFSMVYTEGMDTDVYQGEVIAHLSDGTIKVKTEVENRFVEETWRNWFDRAEFIRRYGSARFDGK